MGKKLRFWAELYSEVHELDSNEELMITSEEWDTLSEKDKYDLVEDWAEGQLHCGYDEIGEEPDFAEEEIADDLYDYDQEQLRRYQGSEDCDDCLNDEDELEDDYE